MIRINLLPPEITEKRRSERRWTYIVYAAAALFVILGVFWGVMFLQVQGKTADVAGKKQQAASIQQQAEAFKVFEDRESDLKARQAMADKALAYRATWAKLFNEMALVLPHDVWLTSMHVDEKHFDMRGSAVNAVADKSSSGFKPVAKLLVHMSDLQQLENVWLTQSSTSEFLRQPILQFDLTADVATPTPSPTPGGASAPPTTQ